MARPTLPAIRGLLLAPVLLVLCACAAAPAAQAPAASAPARTCEAAQAQFAVGHDAGLAIQDQARERSGAGVVRTVRPGQVITMEFRTDRLTLELDAGGKVTRVRCG